MGCHEGPHPYPQGTMKHQKGHKPFEEPNHNENLKEAQKLKKERASITLKNNEQK
jgi:hypothetical protein